MPTLVRDHQFHLVTEFAKPDAKKRLSLGDALSGYAFNVYKNKTGQIVLDPVRAVPEAELWLFQNPKALRAVKQGLKEAGEGKLVDRGSFAKFAAR